MLDASWLEVSVSNLFPHKSGTLVRLWPSSTCASLAGLRMQNWA